MAKTSIKAPETIAAAFTSLIDRGWISRERKRNKDGKIIGGFNYQLNEYRIDPNEDSDLNRKKPLLGKNTGHNNTESLNNTELSTTIKDARGFEEKDNLKLSCYPLVLQDAVKIPFEMEGKDVDFYLVNVVGSTFAKLQLI